MAGDWIKFELATLDKPEVIRIGRQLGLSQESVCGWLVRFWGWLGTNSVDGVVDGVVGADVDMVLSLPGFSAALAGVGWIQFDDVNKRLIVPNFDRHNGESSKKRALKTRRQANWRASNVDAPVDAVVDQKVPPEKRREEKIKHEAPPNGGTTIWDFGKSLFAEQGISQKIAGGLIGSWLRDYPEADVASAIRAAAGKADARSYVAKILQGLPRKDDKPKGPNW